MGIVTRTTSKALEQLRAVKVATITELMLWLGCSMRTAHRRLKEWGAINSYNGNGRFYTLPEVTVFDADGLWRWRDAFFSRHGNLTETVVALISAAPAGLTAAELGKKLGMNAHSFISRLANHPQLSRRRVGGRHVYMAADAEISLCQGEARLRAVVRVPSDAEAVLVFAEMLRSAEVEPEKLARQLAVQGTPVEAVRIKRLLELHGLEKKATGLLSRLP